MTDLSLTELASPQRRGVLKARRLQVDIGSVSRSIVILGEAGIQKKNEKNEILDTRFREYDEIMRFVFKLAHVHFVHISPVCPSPQRRGVSDIPDGDTKSQLYEKIQVRFFQHIEYAEIFYR